MFVPSCDKVNGESAENVADDESGQEKLVGLRGTVRTLVGLKVLEASKLKGKCYAADHNIFRLIVVVHVPKAMSKI